GLAVFAGFFHFVTVGPKVVDEEDVDPARPSDPSKERS
ncbi:MAG: formate dehydrogenase subunit beta, partial [Proteobacteria bacterium]|nr:formate dehydrogenase subunit beta [Pseudomonadota bacterium]